MNIELSLLAVMLKTGDFGPIIRDELTEDHFETDEGKILLNFITTYRNEGDGTAKFPSLKIARHRFANSATVELPEPDPGDSVHSLTHEVLSQRFRSQLRQYAILCDDAASSSDDPIKSVNEMLITLRKLTEKQQRTQHASLATGIKGVVESYKKGEILPDGVPWPWESLTKATKGLHKREFIVFAGRPKSRKTFTALRVGCNALINHNQRVLVFSPEMPVRQMLLRCVAHLCNLPYREFKDGTLDPADEARLEQAAETYGRIKGLSDEGYQYQLRERIEGLGDTYPSLDIVQSTGRDVTWMRSQIELYAPTMIICDSFYRQRAQSGRRNDTDWKAVSALSREMKDLIMEANVIGLGTHQMNRGAEKTVGDLGSLALADAIGQDADGIYRVVTGKKDGQDVSALFNLGGREVDFDGVMINNKPCWDYSELGVITDQKMVLDLMRQEHDTAAREANEKIVQSLKSSDGKPQVAKKSGQKTSLANGPRRAPKLVQSTLSKQLEEDAAAAMSEDE